MKRLLLPALLFAFTTTAYAQQEPTRLPVLSKSGSFWTVNTVRVKKGMLDKALEYYGKKWLPARVEGVKRNYVKSYALLSSRTETPDDPQIVLVTEYADRSSYDKREEHFQELFKDLKVTGDVIVDGLGRNDILGLSEGLEDYQVVQSSK